MGIPTTIREAIQNRERIDPQTLVPRAGALVGWVSVADELRAAQEMGAKGVAKALALLQRRAPEQAFPQMNDGSHAFAPLLLPLPDKDGFFSCAIDGGTGEAPQVVKLILSIGRPDITHFVADISPSQGTLSAVRIQHRTNDGVAVDCTWRRRPNETQVLLSQMKWAASGVRREFVWARGVGRSSMPEGATRHKWMVKGEGSTGEDQIWIAGGLLK